jgi:riboflavin synthase
MFTGLIREFADVRHFDRNVLSLKANYTPCIGDSIAVNGVCLSVVSLNPEGFSVELSEETRQHIAVENLKGKVHIEPALSMGDKLDGHMVQGHIDCVGQIQRIERKGVGVDVMVSIPEAYMKFIIPKGSVAIDGVSLTVNDVLKEMFRLTIIPITWEKTLFGGYRVGQKVNVETDMFARYIYHMFKDKNPLDWQSVDRILASY